MKKLFTLLTFALFIALNTQAQYWCATDEMTSKALKNDPQVRVARQQFEADFSKLSSNSSNKTQGVVRIIPVVFHILHQCGPENISDAQVQDAIDILNRDFRKLNADTSMVIPSFQGIIADTEIEFRLAQIDNNGNCTNGIQRISTPLTYGADDASKLNYWPMSSYLNIWTCATMANAGTAGYSYYPGSAPPNKDGVIILHDYIGSIGTGSVGNSRALTHEVGHWLNLKHTWGSTNQPGVACGDDDVTDTPLTEGSNLNCNLNLSTCNPPVIENVQNYMDYSYCSRMFTDGQGIRMNNALNVWPRNSVWTQANLQATGTDGSTNICIPTANFCGNKVFICTGGTVSFNDKSTNLTFGTTITRTWNFPGGNPSTSSNPTETVTYNTPGLYSVTLTVTSPAGSDTYTATDMVVVSSNPAGVAVPFSEGFENLTFPGSDWHRTNDGGGNQWESTTITAHTGTTCLRVYNYTGNLDGTDEFFTPAYNCINVTSPTASFWLAIAGRSNTSSDYLKVFLSVNCGLSWIQRYSKSGTALWTPTNLIGTNWVPTASQWRQESFAINQAINQGSCRLRFEYNHDNANNIYIDDINLNGVVGLEEVSINPDDVSLYPNPAAHNATVALNLINRSDIKLSVADVLGKEVYNYSEKNLEPNEYRFDIPSGNFSKGIYMICLTAGEQVVTQKLVVQ